MANQWFRMYAEWDEDPKVQSMGEVDQRRLAMLFCERCKDRKQDETLRAFHWRISSEELSRTKAVFIERGFIDKDWNLSNWNKRQFLSDTSTERVRKYREKKKVTAGNVAVTVPEQNRTETEAETEAEQTLALTSPEAPAELVGVFSFPLSGKQGEWWVSQKLYDELVRAYPGLSVMEQFGKARVWLVTNPTKRKTERGLPKFLNGWMEREQNSGRSGGNTNGKSNGASKEERGAAALQSVLGASGHTTLEGHRASPVDLGAGNGRGSEGGAHRGPSGGPGGHPTSATHQGIRPSTRAVPLLPQSRGNAGSGWPD